MDRNQLLLDAEILDVGDVRSTPGGIETVALRLRHVSEQIEAGGNRVVEVTIDAFLRLVDKTVAAVAARGGHAMDAHSQHS